MPTRYTLEVDLKNSVTAEALENSTKKKEARKVRFHLRYIYLIACGDRVRLLECLSHRNLKKHIAEHGRFQTSSLIRKCIFHSEDHITAATSLAIETFIVWSHSQGSCESVIIAAFVPILWAQAETVYMWLNGSSFVDFFLKLTILNFLTFTCRKPQRSLRRSSRQEKVDGSLPSWDSKQPDVKIM